MDRINSLNAVIHALEADRNELQKRLDAGKMASNVRRLVEETTRAEALILSRFRAALALATRDQQPKHS